jgi:hypothetical protein
MVKRKPRALTKDTRQTGSSDMARDRKRKALAPGKRRSKKGNIYYENRKNRSDVKGRDTPTRSKKKVIKKSTLVLRKSVIIGVTPSGRKMMVKPITKYKTKNNNDKKVAMEILNQLGGKRFIMMTGANQFLSGKNWAAFKLPRAKDGNRRIKITLNSMDTYDIKFMSLGGKINKSIKGIYNDQLKDIISRYTGLTLIMPRVRFR